MSIKLLVIMLMMLIMGCATAGQKFDITAVDRIEVGKTTDKEVISMLSAPLDITKCSNGIYIYRYSYGAGYLMGEGSSVDNLELQLVDGVVIDKWQRLGQY
jgi:hypothetical protein